MQPEDAFRIRHMIEAAEDLAAFTRGRVRGDLDRDRLLALGLARAIEIFGEAAAKTSQEAREKLPAIPWRLAAGMRNRLAHAYFDIEYDLLWSTATAEIPPLLLILRAALGDETPR